MSDDSLRQALEKRLGTLPVMQHDNGYPVQALPKADLLSLLALHPAEHAAVLDPEGSAANAPLPSHLAQRAMPAREAIAQTLLAAANSEQLIGGALWVDGTVNDFTDAVLNLVTAGGAS